MTDQEIRESIKRDVPGGITDEEIDDFLERCNMTIADYRNWLDRALAARRRDNPNYPGPLRKDED